MNKKVKKIILLVLLILLVVPVKARAITDGWITQNDKKYYYENGKPVKGFKEIEGKLYFFSRGDDPYMRTGSFQIDYVDYSFNEDGSAKEGWEDKGGKRYYYEKGKRIKGFKEIDGKLYFFSRGDDPYMRTGSFQIDYIDYSFNEDGSAKEGWEDKGENRYYYEKGQPVKGFKEIGDSLYFFSRGDDPYMRTGFFAIDGYFYNFKETGQMMIGLVTMSDGIRYFKSNGQMAIGITKIGENKYFFNKQGIRVSGFQTQDNKTYFFSRSNDNYMRTGFFAIDGYYYYFASDGVMQTGFQTVENKVRFFSRVDGKMRTGWVNIDGPMYYFNLETGEMLTGNHTIENVNYVFNSDGTLRDGFTTDIYGNVRYYFPDGTYANDWYTIAGTKYFFNSLGVMIGKNVKKVIDVSAHQGEIDWDTVKAQGDVDGVILRVAAGSASIDSQFKRNVQELNRLGIPYGVYIYSYAEDQMGTVTDLGTMHEAELEAMRLIKSLKEAGANLSYPIFYDLEVWESGRNSKWNAGNYEPLIRRFDNIMIQNGYPNWQIYSNKSWAETALNTPYIKEKITWIAQYNHYCTYDGNYSGWQYSSTETIPGIQGNVDVSVWFK